MKKKMIPLLDITFDQAVKSLVKERPKKKKGKKNGIKRSGEGKGNPVKLKA